MSDAVDEGGALPDLTLFGASYSVYTRIVRICLKEKNLAFRFVETDIFNEDVKRRHLSLHPFGKIPVLRCGADEIIETAAIVRFLDVLQPEPPLFPDILSEVASSEQTIEVINSYGYPCLVWKVYVPWRRTLDSGGSEPDFSDIAGEIEACLKFLDGCLVGNAYFCGNDFGAADAFVYPVLACFRYVPWGRERMQYYSNLRSWFERGASRSSISETIFPNEE